LSKLAHSGTNGVYVGVAELVDALGSKSKNGKEGVRTYIAYKGKLYDVSESFLWQDDRYQALHTEGKDLTGSLAEAPHGPWLLERFRVVGILEDS